MSKTIKVYTLKELKELFPEGYKTAHKDYIAEFHSIGEVPWNDEIMDSLKAAVKAMGFNVVDYSIGAYGNSFLNVGHREDLDELTGIQFIGHVYRSIGGKDKLDSCALTGYCADDDFLHDLLQDAREGSTLRDSLNGLGYTARRLMEAECDYAESEDGFLNSGWQDDYFTASGHRVDSSEVDRSDNSIDASLVPDEE